MVRKTPKTKSPKQGDDENGLELLLFTEANQGLVPIGDTGLYATPEAPADVTDCNRYPNSIYCGSVPITNTPVGIEVSIIIDECNIGIELTPVIAFITLPPLQIVYRKEECRFKPQEPNEPPPVEIDSSKPTRYNCRDTYFIFGARVTDGVNDPYIITAKQSRNIIEREVIINSSVQHLYDYADREAAKMEAFFNSYQGDKSRIPRVLNYTIERAPQFDYLGQELDGKPGQFGQAYGEVLHEYILATDEYVGFRKLPYKHNLYQFTWNTEYYTIFFMLYVPGLNPYEFTHNASVYVNVKHEFISSSDLLPDCLPLIIPPPPPKKPKKKNMDCCDDLAGLLAVLIKKVDKLSKIVGVDDYPASVPASLISKDEGFLGNLIPNANKEIPSLTRFLSWYVERFDEIMGQWEIPIEVKDSDPTEPGDQPVGFKLPNMAEAIAEMFGLMLQTSINSETLVNMNTRALIEGGQLKQQTFKTYMMAQAIADHMGFEYKEAKHKIPMLFKPGEQDLDKLLKEGEIEVTAPEYTDPNDLKTSLVDLLQAAAIIKAVYFRKIDPKGDIKQQVKDSIKGFVNVNDKVNSQDPDDNDKNDFDRFLEDAELGFTQTPGIADAEHPYGRNYKERPKIKEIGGDTSDNNAP